MLSVYKGPTRLKMKRTYKHPPHHKIVKTALAKKYLATFSFKKNKNLATGTGAGVYSANLC